jgi:YfiH family protein
VTALPAPFRWDGDHIAADLPGGRVLFSSRAGGVSDGPYASLNLGRMTDDDPARVDVNRDRLAAVVGLPRERFLAGRQVHGARVHRATGFDRPLSEEDGQATALPGAAALVFVADCLPVLLLADGAVAALHCGRRPLAAGIIAEGVAALRELGAAGPITAALGPGARGCCYEVSEAILAEFADIPGARANARNLDLPAVARHRLAEAGVDAVHDTGICTICTHAFFSHRRDAGVTGRQAGVVWRG